MRIKVYFDLGEAKRITKIIEAKNVDAALKELIEAAENGSSWLYVQGTYIATKNEVTGYGLL